ncbi:MAG: DUF2561 family protein [Actinomycetia bacterium]|nr:DUF2561 family protein [Actinomycetes bacterium]MCH9702342.1 DUF2561 family protein [Actinomycetes bacterium]MCH9761618.1 DUF2561 family protein [Actinomycetes bacterium]
MTYLTDNAGRSRRTLGFDLSHLDRIDRILLGSCAAVWLAALGAGVAAVVALIDLSRGHADSGGDSGTPWALYTVIVVSAVVIVAAVPLLLRARRAAADESPGPRSEADAPQPQAPARGSEAPTEKLRVAPATVEAAEPSDVSPASSSPAPPEPQEASAASSSAAVDQVWLRCAVGIACAMGLATLLTSVSTYLAAVGSDAVAWVLYGIAGVVTLGMAVIPWYSLRELHNLVD